MAYKTYTHAHVLNTSRLTMDRFSRFRNVELRSLLLLPLLLLLSIALVVAPCFV